MGQRGPKRTDDRLILMRGGRPRNRTEGGLECVLLQPPRWLSKEAKKHFRAVAKQLYDAGISTALDLHITARYADMLALYERLSVELEQIGAVTEGHRGVPRSDPTFRAWLNLQKELHRTAKELGLSPHGRQGLKMNLPRHDPEQARKTRFIQPI